jgi:ACS family glucarate transporter-like MFS transporter
MNSRWIPRREYSRAQTTSLSGSYLGQTIAYPLTTWLVLTLSWQWTFYLNALLGLVWVLAWVLFAADDPAKHPKVSEAELKDIVENRAGSLSASGSPWSVLRSPQVLFLSLSYLCLVYGVWMIILWLPTYLVKARGFSVQQMGWIGMIPTVTSFAGLISGGMLSDILLKRGYSTRFARAQAPALCIIFGVPFLVTAVLVPSEIISVTCFAIYLFAITLSTGGYWGVPLELNPKLVGAISGVMTCAGNLGGVFGPISAGYIYRATNNWALPFLVAAAFAALAFLIFFFLVDPRPLGEAALAEPELEKKVA